MSFRIKGGLEEATKFMKAIKVSFPALLLLICLCIDVWCLCLCRCLHLLRVLGAMRVWQTYREFTHMHACTHSMYISVFTKGGWGENTPPLYLELPPPLLLPLLPLLIIDLLA